MTGQGRAIGWLLIVLVGVAWPSVAQAPPLDQQIQTLEQLVENRDTMAAVALALELRPRAQAAGDVEREIQVLTQLGLTFIETRNFDRATDSFETAQGLVNEFTPPKTVGAVQHGLLMVLVRTGKVEQANAASKQLLTFATENNLPHVRAHATYLLGASLYRMNQPEQAEVEYRRARERFAQQGDRVGQAMVTNDLAMTLKERGDLKQSLSIFENLLEEVDSIGDKKLTVYVLLELGDVNRSLGNLSEARPYLEKALKIAEEAENTDWRIFSHTYLRDLARASNRQDDAFSHSNAVVALEGQRANERMDAQIARLELSQTLADHDHQLELLEKERLIAELALQRSRTVVIAMTVGAFLLAGLALMLYRSWRTQSEYSRSLTEANRVLDKAAATDLLTGLSNRRALTEHVTGPDRISGKYSLVLVDLDRFKQINDEHGHDHGDAVLEEIAERIRSRLRTSDVAARWGGEEFLVVLSGAGQASANSIAEDLRREIESEPIVFGDISHRVTATFGVAMAQPGSTFEATLKEADQALYEGKEAGRNQVRLAGAGSAA